MTEIKIEKKKPIWPWILLLLGVLAAIWFFFLRDEGIETTDEIDSATTTELMDEPEYNGAVAEYVTFIESDPNAMGLDHEFSHEAISKLTDAVEAVAIKANYDARADIDQAKQYADMITDDPMDVTHSDQIRKAANVLSASLLNLQRAKYPEMEAEANSVVTAASKIDPAVLTLDQKDAVKTFFREAASLLTKMNQ